MTALTELCGNAVFPDGVRAVRIALDANLGVVDSLTPLAGQPEDDTLIFPGFIDAHVHAREYPRPQETEAQAMQKWLAVTGKETFSTAGQAAVNGGVTLFAAMPNDPLPPDNQATYQRKLNTALSSLCPVLTFAAITPRSEPWADIPYKVYLDSEPSSVSFSQWHDLESALVRYKGCRVFFHAEDPEILRAYGNDGPRWQRRAAEAEVSAVEKILELTARFGVQTHICHISAKRSLELVLAYNRSSADRITCEVTPHHLFFSIAEGVARCANGHEVPAPELLECNPPLRSEEDRRFLLSALKEGLVDILASDHAPHTLRDKQNGAPGMPHLDTLGAFAGWLMDDCGFSSERIARVLSSGPARIFSKDVDIPHGSIEPGSVASFTLLRLGETTLVRGRDMAGRPLGTLCGWSPFDGIPLPARVAGTVVRGHEYRFPVL